MASPVDYILVADRLLRRHFLRRHLAAELLLQRLHRLQRMIDRLLADHRAEAREVAADHVVERLVAGMPLDVLEQQHRAFLERDEIGDGRGFEIGVDLGGDALELAHRLDFFEPKIEIAGIGGGGFRARARGRFGGAIAAVRADRDAHLRHCRPRSLLCCSLRSRAGHDLTANRRGCKTEKNAELSFVTCGLRSRSYRLTGLTGLTAFRCRS